MKILLLSLLFRLTLNVLGENVTSQNLTDTDYDVLLWQHVFIKLNTILRETEQLSQNLMDMNKRQEDQQTQLTKLIKDMESFNIRQESQEKSLNELIQNVQEMKINSELRQPWIPIQRRQDGSVDFHRNWHEYKIGFGNPNADFFIGLERLHQMTTQHGPQELLIVLIDFENQTRYAFYDLFRIGNETEKYAIMQLGTYTGDAGNGMRHHLGQPFSTRDRDNNNGKIRNCVETFKGAWWFYEPCYSGHLNGPYRQANNSKTFGVSWHPFRGWNVSLKYAAMMIRPKL